MLEGQLILLTESTDFLSPGHRSKQFYLVPEGQLILLTESTDAIAPGLQAQAVYPHAGGDDREDRSCLSAVLVYPHLGVEV